MFSSTRSTTKTPWPAPTSNSAFPICAAGAAHKTGNGFADVRSRCCYNLLPAYSGHDSGPERDATYIYGPSLPRTLLFGAKLTL